MTKGETTVILLNLLLIVLFIVFYLWYFILIMNMDTNLQFYYLQQSSCNRSQLEIETTRYNTMNLHNDFVPSYVDNRRNYNYLSGLIISGSLIFMIGSGVLAGLIYKVYGGNIDMNITIIICSLILLIAFTTNNFTQNATVKEYINAYNQLKLKLKQYLNNPGNPNAVPNPTPVINTMAKLPSELIASLIKRYRSYHEVTNYLKVPFYSDIEIRDEIKKKLEKEIITNNAGAKSTEINVDELMRFMKFNVNDDRLNVKTDIELITGYKSDSTAPAAASFYTLRQDRHNPYEYLNKQLKSNQTALWIITILILYQIYHAAYQYQEKRSLLIYGIIISLVILIAILMLVRSSL